MYLLSLQAGVFEMLSPSLKQQIYCRWIEFRREPSAFFWVMFMPLLWMVILGFAFSNPRSEVYSVGVEKSSDSIEYLTSAFNSTDNLNIFIDNQEDLVTLMKRGQISLIVSGHDKKIHYLYDQHNPEAMRAKLYVNNALQTAAGRTDPVALEETQLSRQGGRYIDFLIPGLLGLSLMTSSLFGVAMTIVSNRKENLLKRYLATPMKAYEYIVSHIFGRLMVFSVEFLTVIIAGYLIFNFKIFGNFLTFLLVAVLGAGSFTAIALLCAARTKSIPTIGGILNLVTLPMMLVSGVFFSKSNFPEKIRILVDYLPLTALNDALRKIALEGLSLSQVSFELSVLVSYLVVCTLLCKKTFRWY